VSDFVTIATYDDYLSANRDLQILEENGITCYIADENTITMQWLYKNALGGIKIRVVGEDAERAKAILSEKQEGIEPTPGGLQNRICGCGDDLPEVRIKQYGNGTVFKNGTWNFRG
jgi:hypothetical protein